jgi:hypothetical protein
MAITIAAAHTCLWVLGYLILLRTRSLPSIANPGIEWALRFQCASKSVLGGLHHEHSLQPALA